MATQPTTVTLTLPTENTDTSPITPGELLAVDVGYGSLADMSNATVIEDLLTALPAPVSGVITFPWPASAVVPFGTTFIAARVKTSANPGVLSAWSAAVTWVDAGNGIPNAPGLSVA